MRTLLFLGLLSLAPALQAQPGGTSFVIYGIVRQPNGEPARHATVFVTGQSGLNRQIFADDMGRYEIRDLPRGRYQVTASNPADPEQFTDPIEADTGRNVGQRMLVHVYLRLRTDAKRAAEKPAGPVISVAEASQRIPKAAQRAFEHAIKQRTEQKSGEALRDLDKAIDLYPGYFQALAERGHIKIGLGRGPDAAADFAEAVKINPQYEPALRGSGICKIEAGKMAEAVADLDAAVALNPGIASSYLFLGVANLALDRRDAARAALQKALALDAAGAARAHVHLANLAMKENRLSDAAEEIRKYLAAVPNSPDAEKLRAVEAQLRARITKP